MSCHVSEVIEGVHLGQIFSFVFIPKVEKYAGKHNDTVREEKSSRRSEETMIHKIKKNVHAYSNTLIRINRHT